jgi:hypothetical protein
MLKRSKDQFGSGATTVRFIVRCHNCTHGDLACEELRQDLRCPHCQSVPSSYSVDGEEFCWLHQEPLLPKYPFSLNWPFTEYAWRGHQSKFPNAKLYEAHEEEEAFGMSSFCPKCQEAFDRWCEGFAD